MCHRTTCKTCRKITWAGCGRHVSGVKASVPAAEWCPGHAAPEASAGTWFSRLLARP